MHSAHALSTLSNAGPCVDPTSKHSSASGEGSPRGPTMSGPGAACVEQRRDAVVANDGCSLHLFEKPRPKNAPERPARVIGAHAEQERCPGNVPAQDVEQARHTLASPAQRIDVDFEGE